MQAGETIANTNMFFSAHSRFLEDRLKRSREPREKGTFLQKENSWWGRKRTTLIHIHISIHLRLFIHFEEPLAGFLCSGTGLHNHSCSTTPCSLRGECCVSVTTVWPSPSFVLLSWETTVWRGLKMLKAFWLDEPEPTCLPWRAVIFQPKDGNTPTAFHLKPNAIIMEPSLIIYSEKFTQTGWKWSIGDFFSLSLLEEPIFSVFCLTNVSQRNCSCLLFLPSFHINWINPPIPTTFWHECSQAPPSIKPVGIMPKPPKSGATRAFWLHS